MKAIIDVVSISEQAGVLLKPTQRPPMHPNRLIANHVNIILYR